MTERDRRAVVGGSGISTAQVLTTCMHAFTNASYTDHFISHSRDLGSGTFFAHGGKERVFAAGCLRTICCACDALRERSKEKCCYGHVDMSGSHPLRGIKTRKLHFVGVVAGLLANSHRAHRFSHRCPLQIGLPRFYGPLSETKWRHHHRR